MKKVKLAVYVLITAVFLLCMGVLTGRLVLAAETVTEERKDNTKEKEENSIAETPNGWVKKGSKQYYYVNGKMITGWKKMNGKKYYFSKNRKTKGQLLTNTIAGTKKEGYYYVDAKGVQVTAGEVKAAVKFVLANTKTSWSNSKKLKECFKALCKKGEYKRAYDKPSASKMPGYAKYMLTKKRGNCYRHASGVAYIARVLGYESRVAVGKIKTVHGLSAHGWAEVKVKNKWYRCDATFWRRNPTAQYYMALSTSNLSKYRCSDRYKMTIKNGKVSWK